MKPGMHGVRGCLGRLLYGPRDLASPPRSPTPRAPLAPLVLPPESLLCTKAPAATRPAVCEVLVVDHVRAEGVYAVRRGLQPLHLLLHLPLAPLVLPPESLCFGFGGRFEAELPQQKLCRLQRCGLQRCDRRRPGGGGGGRRWRGPGRTLEPRRPGCPGGRRWRCSGAGPRRSPASAPAAAGRGRPGWRTWTSWRPKWTCRSGRRRRSTTGGSTRPWGH